MCPTQPLPSSANLHCQASSYLFCLHGIRGLPPRAAAAQSSSLRLKEASPQTRPTAVTSSSGECLSDLESTFPTQCKAPWSPRPALISLCHKTGPEKRAMHSRLLDSKQRSLQTFPVQAPGITNTVSQSGLCCPSAENTCTSSWRSTTLGSITSTCLSDACLPERPFALKKGTHAWLVEGLPSSAWDAGFLS